MLSIADYDVQATRREADLQRAKAERRANEAELRLKSAITALLDKGSTIKEVASIVNVTEDYITTLLPEFSPA